MFLITDIIYKHGHENKTDTKSERFSLSQVKRLLKINPSPAGFQPGGVFRFENRASVYFDTATYKILKRSIDPSVRRAKKD